VAGFRAFGRLLLASIYSASAASAQSSASPLPAPQNPSPMTESTRAHERLSARPLAGITRTVSGPNGRPVELFIPHAVKRQAAVDLVMHFHGAAFIPHQSSGNAAVAVVNLGAGSGAYHRAFADPVVFDSLVTSLQQEIARVAEKPVTVGKVVLSGFSAGHGAIRAILLEPRHFARVGAILLLDGLHTSYIPERKVLADSGVLDTTNLSAFGAFARMAVRGEKQFLVTHSEIFPGTFASTTECADWLLRSIDLRRSPVLRWGARGMQQLSEAKSGRFELMGFAGNSAPDHIDHFHAMPELLQRLLKP
jgi:acetyl esterase/lipase